MKKNKKKNLKSFLKPLPPLDILVCALSSLSTRLNYTCDVATGNWTLEARGKNKIGSNRKR
jgi:hypothetical protein